MDSKLQIFGLVVLFGASVESLGNFVGEKSIGKRHEYLDSDEQYLVEWEAYTDTQTIVFELTVATHGYVGFGISPVGGMTGADIVVGGVHTNGLEYFSNRHGVGNGIPVVDDNETWELLDAFENATHTYLKIGRQLNTCDVQDVAIGNSTNNFIWSMGQDDVISYHGVRRGTSANIILDPPMPPVDSTDFQLWKMAHTMVMPAKQTTYWCTVKKSPPLPTKHHIVGFRPILDTPESLKYTHHFIVHQCRAPVGSTDEETFEHLVDQPGGDCYGATSGIPIEYCRTYLFVWAVGGKTVVFPKHAGYPFAVDGKPSYYLLEVHFDNPGNLEGINFESGLEIFYTPQLRQYDAGIFSAGHVTSWSITIPPKSVDHIVVGHCSPQCSSNIPETGINVFNILLHSHLAGRKLRLRHFRDGIELPWLSADDNYNFDYQQNRPLLEEVKILPGDQITYECTYNSMTANGAVVGGPSTAEEMCNSFIVYYPEIDMDFCGSEFPGSYLMREFGIETMERGSYNPMVLAPESMANKTYTEVLDTMVSWTAEYRENFQQEIRYGEHRAICGLAGSYFTMPDPIAYPNISKEFVPEDECANRNLPGSGNKQAVAQCALNFIACILASSVVMLRI